MDKLKLYGHLRGTPDKDTRVREFVISTEALDRHGTVLRSKGWDLSRFAGAAFYQHESMSPDPDMALGPATVWQEGKKTVGSIDFEEADLNPMADKILRKIDRGTLKNASVGFIPINIEKGVEERGEDPDTWYMDGELLEFSVVNIPSNYQAQLRQANEEIGEYIEVHKQGDEAMDFVTTTTAALPEEEDAPKEKESIPLSVRKARVQYMKHKAGMA